jgi:hypothetical protein
MIISNVIGMLFSMNYDFVYEAKEKRTKAKTRSSWPQDLWHEGYWEIIVQRRTKKNYLRLHTLWTPTTYLLCPHKIGLENEDTRKLRNEITLFSTIITVSHEELTDSINETAPQSIIAKLKQGSLKLTAQYCFPFQFQLPFILLYVKNYSHDMLSYSRVRKTMK